MHLTRRHLLALAALSLMILAIGCSERNPTELPPARGNVEPLVFDDALHPDVYGQAFFETHITGFEVDSTYAYDGLAQNGARSIKFNVPPAGSSLGIYTGGVFTSGSGRNLSDFNALTFYARATYPITLNLAGFGNDNTGTSRHEAGRANIPLTTEWKYFVLPIPNPEKLLSERGLFTFAEGLEDAHPLGYDFWVDEIRYAKLDNITNPRPVMPTLSKQYLVGQTAQIGGISTTFAVDGVDVQMDHMPGYFDFTSSDPTVAVAANNGVRIVGTGDATLTAKLGDVPVQGSLVVTGFASPGSPAPKPTQAAANVISVYSDAYDNRPVKSWRTEWSPPATEHSTFVIDGNEMHSYTIPNSSYVGVEFDGRVDVSEMTHLHLDVYAPYGTNFSVKLFAKNATDARNTDSVKLTFNAESTPAFEAGKWSSLEIPMESFGPPRFAERTGWVIGMVLETTDANLLLVDNIYWHK